MGISVFGEGRLYRDLEKMNSVAGFCRIRCQKRGKGMELQQILSQPESKILEFKRDLSSIEPILKTIVAFANTAGGILIIGRDADGVVVGVKDVLKAEESLANSIADRICPALLPELEIATVEGKDCSEIAHIHF